MYDPNGNIYGYNGIDLALGGVRDLQNWTVSTIRLRLSLSRSRIGQLTSNLIMVLQTKTQSKQSYHLTKQGRPATNFTGG